MKRIFLVVLSLAAVSLSLFSQSKAKVDLKKLDNYYAQMVKDWGIPSTSIGIVKDGELVFVGTYGVIEIGKPEKPDENTLYGIASNSKAFTASIIGMLVQEGKLKWNDKVKKYLPWFEVYDPWVSNEVTIRDLLSHRVGLGTFSGDVIWYKSDFTAEEIVRNAKHIPNAFDFRAGYGYSNIMYIAAGEVIKAVTGKTWSENVKERIFKP
ncbi:MAG TPA: serine hydrolase domain-containing protein, partial [Tenuifilaceae bacterium]|nr:serine hydrolase domain-containing protein [Tenuifilaceae bacterium]